MKNVGKLLAAGLIFTGAGLFSAGAAATDAKVFSDDELKSLYAQQQARVTPIESGEPAAWHRRQAELEQIQKTGYRHASGILGTIGSYINPSEAEAIDVAQKAYGPDWAKVYNEQTRGQDIEHATQGQILEGMPVAGAYIEKTPAMQYLDTNSPTTSKINRAMGAFGGTAPFVMAAPEAFGAGAGQSLLTRAGLGTLSNCSMPNFPTASRLRARPQ